MTVTSPDYGAFEENRRNLCSSMDSTREGRRWLVTRWPKVVFLLKECQAGYFGFGLCGTAAKILDERNAMKMKRSFILSLVLLFCLAATAMSQAAIVSIPFETVEEGEISYYRYGDEDFTGADMLIKDKGTWESFWKRHTAGMTTPPPLPEINLGKEMIIVTILGYQTSGGRTKYPGIGGQYRENTEVSPCAGRGQRNPRIFDCNH